jgi:hypothetical protein
MCYSGAEAVSGSDQGACERGGGAGDVGRSGGHMIKRRRSIGLPNEDTA